MPACACAVLVALSSRAIMSSVAARCLIASKLASGSSALILPRPSSAEPPAAVVREKEGRPLRPDLERGEGIAAEAGGGTKPVTKLCVALRVS